MEEERVGLKNHGKERRAEEVIEKGGWKISAKGQYRISDAEVKEIRRRRSRKGKES